MVVINHKVNLELVNLCHARRYVMIDDGSSIIDYYHFFDLSLCSSNPYNSVDPAPPSLEGDPQKLKETLLNESLPLFERYR